MREKRYPRIHRKLESKGHGPFEALKKVNSNAFIFDLSLDLKINIVINMKDLTLYYLPIYIKTSDDSPQLDIKAMLKVHTRFTQKEV